VACFFIVDDEQELTTRCQREYFNFATAKGFDGILQRISNRIHDYYLLSYQPSAGPPMTLHTLAVRIADRPDAVVQTRKSYWYGTSESPASAP